MPASAANNHKIQDSTTNKAAVSLLGAFQPGMVHVALSRSTFLYVYVKSRSLSLGLVYSTPTKKII